jgi:hypothetical protein
MSATRRNVAYFRANRGNLATWIPVCRHTFVSRFPDIDGPRTDNIWSSVLLIPMSNGDLHNCSPQQIKPKKSSAASIPSRRVFTSCRVVASRRTRFVCLFVRLFVPLVGCCVVSLPLVIESHPVSLPRHVIALRLVSRRPSRRCVSSSRVVVSRSLTQLVMPALFDCCVYCRHRAAAATIAVAVPLPLPLLCRAAAATAPAAVLLVVVVVVVGDVVVVVVVVVSSRPVLSRCHATPLRYVSSLVVRLVIVKSSLVTSPCASSLYRAP